MLTVDEWIILLGNFPPLQVCNSMPKFSDFSFFHYLLEIEVGEDVQ